MVLPHNIHVLDSILEKKVVGVIKRTKKGGVEQKAHFGHIFAVAISSDGRYIVSGGHDSTLKVGLLLIFWNVFGSVQVWNFETLEHVRDFAGHRGPITSLVFQLKTNYLFSASRDRSVKVCSVLRAEIQKLSFSCGIWIRWAVWTRCTDMRMPSCVSVLFRNRDVPPLALRIEVVDCGRSRTRVSWSVFGNLAPGLEMRCQHLVLTRFCTSWSASLISQRWFQKSHFGS